MGMHHNSSAQLPFEKVFDHNAGVRWLNGYWTWSFWFSGLYVIFVHLGRRYMEDRPKFELRTKLAVWSAVLAIFSICGAVRTVPELIYFMTEHGVDETVCNTAVYNGPLGFWTFLFALSKLYELGDTAFIILRKQKLVFLHWYHHVTVLCYCWYSYAGNIAPGCWFAVLNYTVHSFMYTYYTFKALRFNVPRWINVVITILQMMQMFIGIVVNLRSYYIKSNGGECHQTWDNLTCSLVMYLSYLVLFAKFFVDSYIRKPTRPVVQEKHQEKVEKHFQNGIKYAQNGTELHRRSSKKV